MVRATKPRETDGACDEAQRDRWCVRQSPERPMVRATKPRETGGACDEAQRDRRFVRRSPERPMVRATKPRETLTVTCLVPRESTAPNYCVIHRVK